MLKEKKTGNKMERDLTKGSVFKNLICFSVPYLFSYFLQTLYGLADLMIIGQFEGVESTTAVSIGSQVMHMITVMVVGLAMGTTVTISHAIGAKEKRNAEKYIASTIKLFSFVAVLLTVLLLLLSSFIVSIMSTPLEAIEGTKSYLVICFLGIPFIIAYNIISSVFRGLGDSKSPMYFILIACISNIVLDLLFIGYMGLGPSGAALGTVLSQTISVISSFIYLKKKNNGLKVHKEDFNNDKKEIKSILSIGVPIALQDGLIQIAFILITIIMNRRGLVDAAAVGIVEKIISFLFLVPSSMLSSVSALASQNLGAKEEKRAKSTLYYALLISVSFGVIVTIIMQFYGASVVSLFVKDTNVILAGEEYLKGYVFDTIFAGIHFAFSGYFCALGKSGISFIHNIIAIVLVRIPGVYFFSALFPTNLFPIGLVTASGSLVSSIVCIVAFFILNSKRKKAKDLSQFSSSI